MAPPSSIAILLTLFLMPSISPSLADPRTSQAALVCSNDTALPSDRNTFVSNFLAAMDAVTPQISSQGYARIIEGDSANNSVYAFGECLKDLSKTDCDLCFATCKTQILKCLPFQKATRGGRNYLDGCYLRFDDYNFFGEALSLADKVVCNDTDVTGNQTAFYANAGELVTTLRNEVPKNNGFLVASVEKGNSSVYGLGQCWEFVNESSCADCLMAGSIAIGSCIPKQEGRVLNAGCYMRYSVNRFYNTLGVNAGGGGPNIDFILAAVFSSVALVTIIALVFFFGKRKLAKRRKERKQLGALATTVKKSSLNFKYETLEKATNYFNTSNKLGQGGSGSVFKGILPDGRTVAVKRLFFNTRQWVDQFFNEINLISGINHKNLVKLLGCSITGPESLLVYEYVPNKSLHYHLSDSRNSRLLNWEMRYNIILGTAEGLAYLHEESQCRIIHRDIKLSNILLDENYTTKIADFGLARLFPEDRTHLSTGVAGTLGYMAPEYLVHGKLTVKADVFSFGVLVVEVISGRKSNSQTSNPLSVLQTVWNQFKSGRLSEAVDPVLEGRFPVEKATRVLHIGLLCAQASADLRPSMSKIVEMLKDGGDGHYNAIPPPSPPPFLTSSAEIALRARDKPSSQYGSSSYSSENNPTLSEIEPR